MVDPDPKITPSTAPQDATSIASIATNREWQFGATTLILHDCTGNPDALAQPLQRAVEAHQILFKQAPSPLQVTIVTDLSSWSVAAPQYAHLHFAWGVTLDNGHVVVKSPEFARIEPSRFERVLAHEVNHAFWLTNFGREGAGWSPIWVVEGLANYVSAARDLLAVSESAHTAIDRGRGVADLEFHYRDLSGPEELVTLYSLWRAFIEDIYLDEGPARLMTTLGTALADPCNTFSEETFQRAFEQEFRTSLSSRYARFLKRYAR